MSLSRPKTKTTDHPTRAEFEALAVQCEALKTITAVAVAAFALASKSSPGTLDSDCRARFAKLARAAGLDSAERTTVQDFFAVLERMDRVEAQREFAEQQARARPPTFDTMKVPNNWRG